MPQRCRDLAMAVVVLTLRFQLLRRVYRRELAISCLIMLGGLPAILSALIGADAFGHWFDVLTSVAGGVCIGLGVSGVQRWWHG